MKNIEKSQMEVEMENDAILLDIDTPEALAKFTG